MSDHKDNAWEVADQDVSKLEHVFRNQKEAVAFLIDAGEHMMELAAVAPPGWPKAADWPPPGGVYTPPPSCPATWRAVDLAVYLVQTTMRNKILNSEHDYMSVTFYSTRESVAPVAEAATVQGHAHVATLGASDALSLDVPCASRILVLEKLGDTGFDTQLGSHTGATAAERETELHDGLWTCQELLDKTIKGRASLARRVLLLSNDRAPPVAECAERARVMREMGIPIAVLPLAPEGATAAWARIHTDTTSPAPGASAEPFTAAIDEMCARVRRRVHRLRKLASLTLTIEPGAAAAAAAPAGGSAAPPVSIACALLSTLAAAGRPATVPVDKATHQALKAVTEFTGQDTGAVIRHVATLPRALAYGALPADAVVMSAEEAAAARGSQAARDQVTLLGFAPSDVIRLERIYRPPWFLVGDDALRTGSSTALSALIAACSDRDRVGIACLVRGPAQVPRLVALVPSMEPEGLHVVPLPWKEDVRPYVLPAVLLPPAAEGPADATAALEAAAGAVADAFLLAEYDPRAVPNPALVKFYAYLEASALDQPVLPTVQDYTLPDIAGASHRGAHDAAAAFRAALDAIAEPDPEKPARGTKRAAPQVDEDDVAEVDRLAAADQLEKATNKQLGSWLASRGKAKSGVKAELLARVRATLVAEP